MGKRRIFIGDLQGCREELEDLLELLRYDGASDELHPVGDLVNRGPDSLGTLRLLRDLGAGGVLGNHDMHLVRTVRGERRAGPRERMEAVLEAEDREDLVAWLLQRPLLRAFDDLLCVHAGLHPLWEDPAAELAGVDPLSRDPRAEFAVLVRHCDAEGNRPERDDPAPPAPFAPWWTHWERRQVREPAPRKVVFGHWARQGLLDRPGLKGLDSGCVYGGRLSAYIPEEDRIVSVPARRAWCPV
jgi:bis(5'-nucleosyl)-tetraphosphatase (symmetrical)